MHGTVLFYLNLLYERNNLEYFQPEEGRGDGRDIFGAQTKRMYTGKTTDIDNKKIELVTNVS